jgi:hypothetical protein
MRCKKPFVLAAVKNSCDFISDLREFNAELENRYAAATARHVAPHMMP